LPETENLTYSAPNPFFGMYDNYIKL
jgi:hypothetical protein